MVENSRSKDDTYDDTVHKLIEYVPLHQKGRKENNGTKDDPVVLKAETLDKFKQSRYCQDVKGWEGIGCS